MVVRGEVGVSLGVYEKALPQPRDWDAFFAQVASLGFSFVDLSIDESDARAAPLDWNASHRERVRRAAVRSGVLIGGLCLSLHRRVMPGSVDPAVRRRAAEVYEKAVDLASDLGVGLVQVAGYYAYYEPREAGARQRYVDVLAGAVPHAARAGVTLGIENVDGGDVSGIGDAIAIVDEIASPWVQLYPDIGNIAEHGGDVVDELRQAEGRMFALHVKDVRPGEPRRVPFGSGVVDFHAAFTELSRQRWSGRLMLEMWNDDAADWATRCTTAREFIAAELERAGIRIAHAARGAVDVAL